MRRSMMTPVAMAALSLSFIGAAQAQLLVPKGSKATLTVEWNYQAVGAKKDKYDPRTWKVNRSVQLTAQFVAEKQQPLAQMRATEPEQLADMQGKQGTALVAAKKMEPTMNDMMKIVEKCGENEACIEKEVKAYGSTMQLTPELMSAGKDIDKLGKTPGPRYQAWRSVSQKGTYSSDEFYTAQTADPICMEKPKQRCNRQETRKGGGVLPVPPGKEFKGVGMFEIDSVKKDIVMILPGPSWPMPCTSEIKSDFPDEASGHSTCTVPFSYGSDSDNKPLTFVIAGDTKTFTGTKTVKLPGAEGESGTATYKWTLTLH